MTRPSMDTILATASADCRRRNAALANSPRLPVAVGPSARPGELRVPTGAQTATGRQGAGKAAPPCADCGKPFDGAQYGIEGVFRCHECHFKAIDALRANNKAPVNTATATARKARQRKPPAPANAAESEWVLWLRQAHPDAIVRPHGMTFVFPDGDRYTPDTVMWDMDRMTIYEVKAGYRGPGWEQGMERYKRAKAEWYWLDFALAEKRSDGWYVDGVRKQEG